MKNLRFLIYPIGLLAMLITFQFCSQNEGIKQPEIFPEKMSISSATYNQFVSEYNTFVNALAEDKKELLNEFVKKNYISSNPNGASNGRISKSECNCSPGQAKCNAETWASDCCICCAAGKTAVCGSYFGLANCKCNDEGGEVPSDGARKIESDGTINVYPNRFLEIFSLLERNSVNVTSIRDKFVSILKQN